MYKQSKEKIKSGKLELLVFGLFNGQKFGINVFKVKEILQCPRIHSVPNSHPSVKGLITVRGHNLVVVDLSKAIGGKPVEETDNKFVVVTEYNQSSMAFLVEMVDKILQVEWVDVEQPPIGLGSNYLTAIAKTNNEMIQILDVEKVLYEINPPTENISEDILKEAPTIDSNKYVLVVDDSRVARKQVMICLEKMNIPYKTFENGSEAYNYLANSDPEMINKNVALVLSDIEMPSMDGYTLTMKIRENENLKNLHVVLHTSITGVFNKELVESVGADDFICKFNADILSQAIIKNIRV